MGSKLLEHKNSRGCCGFLNKECKKIAKGLIKASKIDASPMFAGIVFIVATSVAIASFVAGVKNGDLSSIPLIFTAIVAATIAAVAGHVFRYQSTPGGKIADQISDLININTGRAGR